MNLTPIQEFFRGRSVFLTGASGFCGQVLLEKLLRCTEVANIYLLLRTSPTCTASDRLDNLLQQPLFQGFDRATGPNIVPIAGDLSLEGLGLTPEDRDRLCQEVSVVFHSAATVRFIEPLQEALKINVNGTRSIMQLCREMKHIKSVVYVSTAYSQCPRQEIEEKIYPLPANKIAMKKFDLQLITEREILGPWPNTYTFSKAIAEYEMGEMGEDFPLAIVRPSAVLGKCEEPLPGWVTENASGLHFYVVASSLGLLRCTLADSRKLADPIPVDMVANMLIAAAWHTAEQPRSSKAVYNFVSSTQNPITWKQYLNLVGEAATENPPLRAITPYFVIITTNTTLYSLLSFFLEMVPARVMDMASFFSSQKHRFVDKQKKMRRFKELSSFVTLGKWHFHTKNVESLLECMTPADKQMFNIDVKKINWKNFLKDSYLGVRQYILKDPPCTIPEARRRIRRIVRFQWLVGSSILLCLCAFVTWKMMN